MPDISYKIFYNNEPATKKQLDRIEEIVVEQEENMAWEARIKIPLCANERGEWSEGDEDLITTLERIRVEIKVSDHPFVPLIDGPVVGYDSSGSSEPGQSFVTFLVNDDSVYLNKIESVDIFEDKADHEVVKKMFNNREQITLVEVDPVPKPDNTINHITVRRGTEMELMRRLARRNNMYAAVLPGKNPSESRGVFKKFPTEPSDFPPLILLGSERNIESIEIKNENLRPSRVTAATLRIGDKVVMERKSNFRNVDLLGEKHAFEKYGESKTSLHRLPPTQGESVDLQNRVDAESERSSYSFDGSGNVMGNCYEGVLLPYHVISIKTIKDRLVGNYRISQVTHTLSRSTYEQSFKLKRNALTSSFSNNASSHFNESIF